MAAAKHPRPAPLFDFATARGKTDTSAAAGEKMDATAPTLRQKTLAQITQHTDLPYWLGLTADEVASLLGEDILAIRPRLSELVAMGLIKDSGRRRLNAKGNTQIVFQIVPQ